MNATYGMTSEEGKGSTFWFEIPISNPSKEMIKPKSEGNFKNIVLIHPNQSYCEYLTTLFESINIHVKSSCDSFIDLDLNEKSSLMIVEESLIGLVSLKLKAKHGNALIIGDISRHGFHNLSDPLSISQILNYLESKNEKKISPFKDASIEGLRILIVDDHLMILKTFENLLKKLNLGTIEAESNGEAAIQNIKSNPKYDIVFMDIQMPIKDGIEATKEIRELEGEKSKTVVVALTGNSISKSKEEQCEIWRMNDILMKPINKKDILNCISNNLTFGK
jgi:two-component system, sensor histidine kinase and response regulator